MVRIDFHNMYVDYEQVFNGKNMNYGNSISHGNVGERGCFSCMSSLCSRLKARRRFQQNAHNQCYEMK